MDGKPFQTVGAATEKARAASAVCVRGTVNYIHHRHLLLLLTGSLSGCFFSSVEYLEKSKHLQEQLKELRSEIEVLKVEEKQSHMDEIHDQNVLHGSSKYTSIGRVRDCTVCLENIYST